ncbi:hypothetical protein PSCLAVI8L_130198 [Pseudoclavibacter sp. 8L]|nr:hypothetical protein PSCLAVI8L_130198 [Pseudoclavibacter sp. 8L]
MEHESFEHGNACCSRGLSVVVGSLDASAVAEHKGAAVVASKTMRGASVGDDLPGLLFALDALETADEPGPTDLDLVIDGSPCREDPVARCSRRTPLVQLGALGLFAAHRGSLRPSLRRPARLPTKRSDRADSVGHPATNGTH